MTTRRTFLIGTGAGLAALSLADRARGQRRPSRGLPGAEIVDPVEHGRGGPLVVSTWSHGVPANQAAWEVLGGGGRALDAVEAGVHVPEADPSVTSVGYGGRPDRDGHVTLDACIMDERGNAGSVAFLQDIMHPISVARLVMEKTPHVMLVGEGARRFALAQGFPAENLLTEEARRDWLQWLQTSGHQPYGAAADADPGHDTIGMLAIDRAGDLAGACTTSGMSFKMHGRVGDSPIIGAALFVDNAVGAACATGVGEEVMKTVGSFLIVELMRGGMSPAAACHEAVARIVRRNPRWAEIQVGYLAVDRGGRSGAFALQKGFQYAVMDGGQNRLLDAESWS